MTLLFIKTAMYEAARMEHKLSETFVNISFDLRRQMIAT